MQPRPEWAKARRVVVKIGSSLLVDRVSGRALEQLYAERKLAQTTVATIVARLQRRRILARRTRDRQFVYRALVTEADVQHSMVRELTERLFAGDVTALVSHLVSARDMTPGDLARLRKMLQSVRPKTGDSA